MDSNEKESVCYPQPRTLSQRVAIANDFVTRFGYRVPLVVDDMDNRANALYAGWPERFYIVDERALLSSKASPGPSATTPRMSRPGSPAGSRSRRPRIFRSFAGSGSSRR